VNKRLRIEKPDGTFFELSEEDTRDFLAQAKAAKRTPEQHLRALVNARIDELNKIN
jgi:hypothetical protein